VVVVGGVRSGFFSGYVLEKVGSNMCVFVLYLSFFFLDSF